MKKSKDWDSQKEFWGGPNRESGTSVFLHDTQPYLPRHWCPRLDKFPCVPQSRSVRRRQTLRKDLNARVKWRKSPLLLSGISKEVTQ